jgi:hypothetical protein
MRSGVDGNLLVEDLPYDHETVQAILNGKFKPAFWAQQLLPHDHVLAIPTVGGRVSQADARPTGRSGSSGRRS